MNCPLCNSEMMEGSGQEVVEHLFVFKVKNGEEHHHYHVHGPIDKREEVVEMIQAIAKECGIETEIES